MWWHKLINEWTKTDYAFFTLFYWVLMFGLFLLIRLVQQRTLDLVYATELSFVAIPFELLIIVAFQKYSSNTQGISKYSALQPQDFEGEKLLMADLSFVFFYAEWCPFCRKSFHLLKSLDRLPLKVFRVDLSDENNLLWESLRIQIVPTLIAFKDGKEYWRANGISMVGLRKKDFKQAIIATNQILESKEDELQVYTNYLRIIVFLQFLLPQRQGIISFGAKSSE